MPRLTFPVSPTGLLCDVLIGLDGKTTAVLVAAGQPVAPPIACRGLVDTGTDVTCVASAVLRQLGLNQPIAQTTTQTASGASPANLYKVSLSVLDLWNNPGPKLLHPNVLTMELPAVLAGIDVLLGMDILLTARLIIDGPGGIFLLEL